MSEMDPEWEAKVDKILEPIFEQIHAAGIVDACDAIIGVLLVDQNLTMADALQRIAEFRKQAARSTPQPQESPDATAAPERVIEFRHHMPKAVEDEHLDETIALPLEDVRRALSTWRLFESKDRSDLYGIGVKLAEYYLRHEGGGGKRW